MATSTKEIVFPVGVGRRSSFRQEAGRRSGYVSPWAINVRAEDFTGRIRGGSWSPAKSAPSAASRKVYLTDANGNQIVDGSGNAIYVGIEVLAAHSSGVEYADPGDDAPGSHPAQCIYRGRFVRPLGSAVFSSRLGDYQDWGLSQDISDSARPFVFQLSESGEIGEDVTALIPHKDATMICATANSLWVLRGDPAGDGQLRNISRDVGIIGADSWCRDHLDRYYFMSSHGLYTIGAGGDGLQALSEDVIPIELTGLAAPGPMLEYDHEHRAVLIHTAGDSHSWLFDTERLGFWPFLLSHSGSHVAIGPIKLGQGSTFGRLLQLHGILAQGSINVTWRVIVSETAEQAAESAKAAILAIVAGNSPSGIHSSGVWTGTGANHRSYPRARGKYMSLILSAGDGDWAFEGVSAVVEQSGAWR